MLPLSCPDAYTINRTTQKCPVSAFYRFAGTDHSELNELVLSLAESPGKVNSPGVSF